MFKAGDIIEVVKDASYKMVVKPGALAVVVSFDPEMDYPLRISWIRNQLSGSQGDGRYSTKNFKLHVPLPEWSSLSRFTDILDED